jgi:hypothetical protein
VTLRLELERARAAGLGFEDCWGDDALAVATESLQRPERGSWRDILEGQRPAWRSAYERTPGERPIRL